jgi:hypothetical protein
MSGAATRLALALRSGELAVTRLAEGSGVVLHVASLRSRTLNPAGMLLLDALAGGALGTDELVGRLDEVYALDPAVAARDVDRLLSDLSALLASPR